MLPNGMTRQYSLCGDRWDPFTYTVGVLREQAGRGGSAYVHDALQPGHQVGVGGPRDNFPLVPAERYLFVAGGIGITPLVPMIQQAELLGADWQLLYGGRERASMAFVDRLEPYGRRVQIIPQDVYGMLDLPAILGEPQEDTRVYCCGPSPLLSAIERTCAGWPPHSLHTERFIAGNLGAPSRTTAFEVNLARTGKSIRVEPGTSVLEALRASGVEVLSSCQQGTCGTCETTVLRGRLDHRDSILDDDQRAANDCMFVCVSSSLDDRLVLDL
ncbi:MAG TPA: PDR/VanB family oxidoreductase [Trebonia sp.]|nr:PDR/VanB family oxidoreductase [Trebonia sp.]